MTYSHFIGVDISKAHIDLACLGSATPPADSPLHCANDESAITKTLESLLSSKHKVLVCAEFTGMYCEYANSRFKNYELGV